MNPRENVTNMRVRTSSSLSMNRCMNITVCTSLSINPSDSKSMNMCVNMSKCCV